MNDHDRLVQQFLDDRDGLTDEQLDALVLAVQNHPQLAIQLKDLLFVDELLAQAEALDRGDFPAQMAQRLRDLTTADRRWTLAQPAPAPSRDPEVTRAFHDFQRWQRRARWYGRLGVLAAAGLVVLAVTAGTWMVRQSRETEALAAVQDVAGQVWLTRNGQTQIVESLPALNRGDHLETADDAALTVRYDDATTIQIGGGTSVAFEPESALHPDAAALTQKHVLLTRGALSAQITPQPADRAMRFSTPHAHARVLGTSLRIEAAGGETRLLVAEGKVELGLAGGSPPPGGAASPVTVGAYQSAVATADGVTLAESAWPTNPAGLSFRFQTRSGTNFVVDPATHLPRGCRLEPENGARFDAVGACRCGPGGFTAADAELFGEARQAGAWSLEFTCTPQRQRLAAPLYVLAGRDADGRVLFGVQQKSQGLVLRWLRPGQSDPAGLPLGPVTAGRPMHVALTYTGGVLRAWLDGKALPEQNIGVDALTAWTSGGLHLGETRDDDTAWEGTVEGLASYHRALSAEEVAANRTAYAALLQARKAAFELRPE